MRALVTGAGGFAGAHLCRTLLADGWEVVGTLQEGTEPPPGLGGVRWLPLELTSADSIRMVMAQAAPERVFHLAGQASVAQAGKNPAGTWEVNATGTLHLVDALPEGARLLYVSSAEVYGVVPEAEQPIGELRPMRPQSAYAASKAAGEMAVVAAACGQGAQVVIARSFSHTGPGQDARFAMPSFARQLAAIRAGAAEPVLRVGNLKGRRDYLDVRDVVRAYRLLAERGEPGRAYNVATGVANPLRALVDVMVELSGTGARVEVDPLRVRPVDLPLLCGDARALRELGWEPEIGLRQTLADLLDQHGALPPAGAA